MLYNYMIISFLADIESKFTKMKSVSSSGPALPQTPLSEPHWQQVGTHSFMIHWLFLVIVLIQQGDHDDGLWKNPCLFPS